MRVGKTGEVAEPRRVRKPLGAKVAGKTQTGPDGQTWSKGTRGLKLVWLNQQLAEDGVSSDTQRERSFKEQKRAVSAESGRADL